MQFYVASYFYPIDRCIGDALKETDPLHMNPNQNRLDQTQGIAWQPNPPHNLSSYHGFNYPSKQLRIPPVGTRAALSFSSEIQDKPALTQIKQASQIAIASATALISREPKNLLPKACKIPKESRKTQVKTEFTS